jgi:hypothetical protein
VRAGTTRYHTWNSASTPGVEDNKLARVEQFYGYDYTKPQLILDVAGRQMVKKTLLSNGEYDPKLYDPGTQADITLRALAPKFYFFGLYGL